MAAFSSMSAAAARARALMDNGKSSTYKITVAHPCRTKDGVIAVRVLRWTGMSPARVTDGQLRSKAGGWEYLTDDTAV